MGSILSCDTTKLRFFVSSLALNFQWSLSVDYEPLGDVKPTSVAFTGKGKAAAKRKSGDSDDDASSHKDEDEDDDDGDSP